MKLAGPQKSKILVQDLISYGTLAINMQSFLRIDSLQQAIATISYIGYFP